MFNRHSAWLLKQFFELIVLFLMFLKLLLTELRPLTQQALHYFLVLPIDPYGLLLFNYVIEGPASLSARANLSYPKGRVRLMNVRILLDNLRLREMMNVALGLLFGCLHGWKDSTGRHRSRFSAVIGKQALRWIQEITHIISTDETFLTSVIS